MTKLGVLLDIFETEKNGTMVYCSGDDLQRHTKEELLNLLHDVHQIYLLNSDSTFNPVDISGFDILNSLTERKSVTFAVDKPKGIELNAEVYLR